MPKSPESFSQDESQEEKPKEIKDAENPDELFEILDRKGEITGSSGKEYSTEELKKKIKNVNNKLMSYAFTSEDDPLDRMALIKNDLRQITGGRGFKRQGF